MSRPKRTIKIHATVFVSSPSDFQQYRFVFSCCTRTNNDLPALHYSELRTRIYNIINPFKLPAAREILIRLYGTRCIIIIIIVTILCHRASVQITYYSVGETSVLETR